MAIYFATTIVLIVATIRQPGVAAGALLCTYGLEQWSMAKSYFFFHHAYLTNSLTAGLILLAIAVRLVRRKAVFQPLPLAYFMILGLYAWAGVACAWSSDTTVGWSNFTWEIKFVGVFGFLLPLTLHDRDDMKACLLTVLAMGVPLCVLMLTTVQWGYRTIIFDTRAMLTAGEIGEGNPLAIAALGGYIALAAFLMNFRGAARFWQITRYAVVGVGFAIAVRSGSRGQALAIIVTALALMPYSRRFKDVRSFIGFAASLLILAVVLSTIFDLLVANDRFLSGRWESNELVSSFTDARISKAATLLGEWIKGGPFRWIIGLGTSASYPLLGIYPHIVAAEVLGEFGVVAFGIYCYICYRGFKSIAQLWPLVKDRDEDRGLVAAMASFYLFQFILSFKEGAFLGAGLFFGLSVVMSRMLSFYRNELELYEQLDRGYTMTDEEREHEFEEYDPEWADESGGELQPAGHHV